MVWYMWSIVLGAIFAGIGIPLGMTMPYIFSAVLHSQLQLGPGSATFSEWNENPVPIYIEFHMWNWTNAEEFSHNFSVVPEFEEVGPFTFQVMTERVNVTWNDNRTVTFSPARSYIFQPSMSIDLNTSITTLNPVPAVLAYYSRFWPSTFFKLLINKEVELREKLFKSDTAGNWMFYGIDDSLLELIVPLKDIAQLPLPFEKFAWFYGRNQSATAEGTFTIGTGTDDLANLGKIVLWRGENTTASYTGTCGQLGGTTGELLPPMKEVPKNLSVFSADICSQVALEFTGETTVSGVSGWQFSGTKMAFDDGSLYPESKCFCEGECVPAGARNISVCKFGAPAFISFPHFYLADPTYSARIKGMTPNVEHRFQLKVEPTTGVPLSVNAQLQVNLLIRHSDVLDMYRGMPEIYIPMLWFREKAEITPDLANMLKMVLLVPTVGNALFYTVGVLGLVALVGGFYIVMRTGDKNDDLGVTETYHATEST